MIYKHCFSDKTVVKTSTMRNNQISVKKENALCFHKTTYCYNMSARNIALSGDVELNPGPRITSGSTGEVLIPFSDPDYIFKYRLHRYGLRPLEVGGGGDCFFKSVSHQLYGDPSHHLDIRATGVKYLNENPEWFIESNVEASWLQYVTDMSCAGTWADNIIIQAVADAMNLKIHIIESDDNFRNMTLVEPANTIENTSIFIGHIGQMHYVSTTSVSSRQKDSQQTNCTENNLPTTKPVENPLKRKHNHTPEIVKRKRTNSSCVDANPSLVNSD